jgi:hypothetical protein
LELTGLESFPSPLTYADDQSVRKLKVRCVCTTIAREQGSLLVLVCEPMTFLQSNGPVSHEPRAALRQMPTATAPDGVAQNALSQVWAPAPASRLPCCLSSLFAALYSFLPVPDRLSLS